MKAVIYARYSSDSQREESIEGQLRECTEYAERNWHPPFSLQLYRQSVVLPEPQTDQNFKI